MERIKQPRIQALTWLALALLGLAGCAAIWYATRWGPWAYSDSTTYITIARTILNGQGVGYMRPTGEFVPMAFDTAPLYPLLLSAIGSFGVDLFSAARYLNVLLFGLTVFSSGAWIYLLTGAGWASFSVSLLLLCMPSMVSIFSGAMTEPLFYFTGINGVFAIIYFTRTHKSSMLLAGSGLIGLSMVTRYPGVVWAAAGLAALLVLDRGYPSLRLKNLVLYAGCSFLLLGAWYIYSSIFFPGFSPTAAREGPRVIKMLVSAVVYILRAVWSWLPFQDRLPEFSYPPALVGLVLAGLLALGVILLTVQRSRRNPDSASLNLFLNYSLVWLAYSAAYLLFIIFSYIYRRPTPDLVDRTLFPAAVGMLFFFLFASLYVFRVWKQPVWARALPAVVVIILVLNDAPVSLAQAENDHVYGQGYTSAAWRTSPTLEALSDLPFSMPLITNEPAAVSLLTGRTPYTLMEIYASAPREVFTRYGEDLSEGGQQVFRTQKAALVLFNNLASQIKPVYGDKTEQRVQSLTEGLSVYAETRDGAIYFYPAGQ